MFADELAGGSGSGGSEVGASCAVKKATGHLCGDMFQRSTRFYSYRACGSAASTTTTTTTTSTTTTTTTVGAELECDQFGGSVFLRARAGGSGTRLRAALRTLVNEYVASSKTTRPRPFPKRASPTPPLDFDSFALCSLRTHAPGGKRKQAAWLGRPLTSEVWPAPMADRYSRGTVVSSVEYASKERLFHFGTRGACEADIAVLDDAYRSFVDDSFGECHLTTPTTSATTTVTTTPTTTSHIVEGLSCIQTGAAMFALGVEEDLALAACSENSKYINKLTAACGGTHYLTDCFPFGANKFFQGSSHVGTSAAGPCKKGGT